MRKFEDIPEKEIIRTEWQEEFRSLGERGRETTWGLKDHDKRVLGLCVMLDESLERESALNKNETFAEDLLHKLQNKLKGLQLENGRLKAKITKMDELITELKAQAYKQVMSGEVESVRVPIDTSSSGS